TRRTPWGSSARGGRPRPTRSWSSACAPWRASFRICGWSRSTATPASPRTNAPTSWPAPPSSSAGEPAVLLRPELGPVGVTVLWGSTFIVTKDVVRAAPPMLYLVFRFGLAALVLFGLYGRRVRGRRLIVDGVVLGVLNSLGLVLQVIGQVFTTASKSAFITSLNTPL